MKSLAWWDTLQRVHARNVQAACILVPQRAESGRCDAYPTEATIGGKDCQMELACVADSRRLHVTTEGAGLMSRAFVPLKRVPRCTDIDGWSDP